MSEAITHIAAFRQQKDFAPEAKLVVHGDNQWKPNTSGFRFYEQVLAKKPATVQVCLDRAAKLDEPFTAKQVQGHLRWLYTAGEMEVDGKSFPVAPKIAKPKAEAAKPEAAKVEPKAEPPKVTKGKFKAKTKVAAASKRAHVKTKKVA
jgi:hypothetical protein